MNDECICDPDYRYGWDDRCRVHGHATTKPGLHRTGPNPWDFTFNPSFGMKVGIAIDGGGVVEAFITNHEQDETTGELTLTLLPADTGSVPTSGVPSPASGTTPK